MKKPVFIFFILLSSILFSQKKDKSWFLVDLNYSSLSKEDKYNLDSILPLYHKATSDTVKLNQLLYLSGTLGDENLWPLYNQLMLDLAEKGGKNKDYLRYKAEGINNLGYFASNVKGDLKEALLNYEEALKIYQSIDNIKGISVLYNNLADTYQKSGDNDKAIYYHLKSLEIKEKLNDQDGVGISLLNLGLIYKQQGDYSGSINCYSKALKIFEKASNKRNQAMCLNNIAKIYLTDNESEKAINYFNKALETFESIGEKQAIATTCTNLGSIYNNPDQRSKAIMYFRKAAKLREEIGDKVGVANSFLNLSSTYDDLDDSALILAHKALGLYELTTSKQGLETANQRLASIYLTKKNYPLAEKHSKIALQLSTELGFPNSISNCASILHQIYKFEHKDGKALEMYELHIKMRDSLSRAENKKAILRQQFKYEYDKKSAADSVQQAASFKHEQIKHEQEIARQRLFTYGGIIGFVLMLIIAFISFTAFKTKQSANKEISEQKHIIEEKQKAIVDSINYAKKIQYTLLAHDDLLKANLNDHFVLYKPKDIVSGDFYWATIGGSDNQLFYLAVCDSTGHGVPGAFMSLLNIGFLNEAISEKKIHETNEVLNYARKRLIESISKDDQQDGFDGALICFNKANASITYSSANNRVTLFTEHQIKELAFDKMPVGQYDRLDSFKQHTIQYNKGDILYLFTDGYSDQFGGPQGKKFKYKQLSTTFFQIAGLPLDRQKEALDNTFNSWKGNLEQIDDVCIIGIRL